MLSKQGKKSTPKLKRYARYENDIDKAKRFTHIAEKNNRKSRMTINQKLSK